MATLSANENGIARTQANTMISPVESYGLDLIQVRWSNTTGRSNHAGTAQPVRTLSSRERGLEMNNIHNRARSEN